MNEHKSKDQSTTIFDITDGRYRYRPCPRCDAATGMGLVTHRGRVAVQCICGHRGPEFDAVSNERDRQAFDGWNSQEARTSNLWLSQLEAGARVLWEKQFENSPWAGKVHLIRPESLGEYMEVARRVYEAMTGTQPATGGVVEVEPHLVGSETQCMHAHETRAHPEHRCERCRGPNVRWFAPSPLWNAAHGEWDILCPICFVQLAEAAGIDPTAWEVRPEVLPQETSEPTPRYSCFVDGCPGDHPSKHSVCHKPDCICVECERRRALKAGGGI